MNANEVPLIQEVAQIVGERVPAEDYQQQVDRWNRYQEGLDKIERQCRIENVRFRRRMKTSYSERRIRNIHSAIAYGLIVASLWIVGICMWMTETQGYILSQNITSDLAQEIVQTAIVGGIIIGLSIGMHTINTGRLPEKIRFHCAPIINIDDLYYLQRYVHGMAKEKHDPKVVLPELTMEIPRSWIAQQSLLKVMDTMKNIKL